MAQASESDLMWVLGLELESDLVSVLELASALELESDLVSVLELASGLVSDLVKVKTSL
jgi:hypothetical protein